MIPFMEEESEANFAALGEIMARNFRVTRSAVVIPHPDLIIRFMEESEARFVLRGETMAGTPRVIQIRSCHSAS
jgi:hypothetical protein